MDLALLHHLVAAGLGADAATAAATATATASAAATVPSSLFPFAEVWWVYAVFVGLVLAIIALDLGVFHKKAHVVGFKEAATWSVVWVCTALTVNLIFWLWAPGFIRGHGVDAATAQLQANQAGMEFLAGYVVEKALAVDNIFVIAMIFAAFGVPAQYQHRVLFWGILGALVFRAIFIGMGSVVMQYHWVVIAAGVFLIFTGIKMVILAEQAKDPANNPIVRFIKRFVPVYDKIEDQSFFKRHQGVLMATPLFLALIMVEVSDIVFAIDSVPAIFALTDEALIVFMSNILAILGLRAMYFLLAGVMDRFHLLKYSLSAILVFVGLKMVWLNDAFGGKFPITWSLLIITGLLAVGVAASLMVKPKAH